MTDNISKALNENGTEIGFNLLESYFTNHSDIIKGVALKNVNDFFQAAQKQLDKFRITNSNFQKLAEDNLHSPDFAKTYENAIRIAALTSDTQKKGILASLLITRFYSETESTETLILKTACEKVEFLNMNQILILGYLYAIKTTKLYLRDRTKDSKESLIALLEKRFHPFQNINLESTEKQYLDSIGCADLKYIDVNMDFYILPYNLYNSDAKNFGDTSLFKKLYSDWNEGQLKYLSLTVIGEKIGAHCMNLISLIS